MRLLLSILAIYPFFAFGSVRGWLCRIRLSPFESKAQSLENGTVNYYAAYTDAADDKYFWWYEPNPSYPNYSTPPTSPYQANKDMNGITPPQPPQSTYLYWIVQSDFLRIEVSDSNGADLSPIGDLNSKHGLSPIYDSSMGNPLTDDHNVYTGINYNFDYSSIQPLQGSQGDNSPSIYYTSSGMASSGSSQDGYEYVYKDDSWQLVKSSDSSNGSVDLSGVLSSLDGVKTNQETLRQQLIQQLGAAGNSWVYDCKLSIEELVSLTRALGLDIPNSISSHGHAIQDVINQNSATLNNSLQGVLAKTDSIDSNLNSLHGDVVAGVQELHDISSSASAQTHYLSSIQSLVQGINGKDYTDKLDDIISVLNKVKDNTTASVDDFQNLPQPDFVSQNPDDELPLTGWKDSLNTRSQYAFGQMVSWGSSPSVPLGSAKFDFISRLLTSMIGSIPSVGSDPHMFDVDFNIPYVGRIQKSFDFSEWQSITYFRTAMLWVLYLFFALALSRLIFKTFI